MPDAAELEAALRSLEEILARGDDADAVLREAVAALHGLYPYAGILFVEEGELAPGPAAGEPREPAVSRAILFRDRQVAQLRLAQPAGSPEEDAFLGRVCELLSPWCLVGWDTGGVPWPGAGEEP